MAGKMRIRMPDDPRLTQTAFAFAEKETLIRNAFPKVHYSLDGFYHVLRSGSYPRLGLDLEFNTDGRPTVLGIANLVEGASVAWDSRLASEVVDVVRKRGGTLVGYSVMGADKPVLDGATGKETPIELWDDAMQMFYLLHQAFSKSGDRSEEEEDAGSLGFYSLWTCSSIYTKLSQWKVCRGVDCPAAQGHDAPCPEHNVWGYNGIDSLAGVQAFANMIVEFEARGIPWPVYRERLLLSEICEKMRKRGIAFDPEYVEGLRTKMNEYKGRLFQTTEGKKKAGKATLLYKYFNPNAPKAVVDYFKNAGIALESAEKADIRDALENRMKTLGFGEDLNKLPDLALDRDTRLLLDTYEYKNAGKGVDPWFGKKYIDPNNPRLLHPRFVDTGTQTTRLSSSAPNQTNIPARGWGNLVRAAFRVRDVENFKWGKADASQLELRSCLWMSGENVKSITGDAFIWLVENSNGMLAKAAEIMASDERQAAKSVSHGADYLEGFTLLTYAELEAPNRRREAEVGALVVYHPKYGRELWEWRGKVVCFTGANLGKRLFGDKSYESRRKANEIQEAYFAAFPSIRKWQMLSLKTIENSNFIKYPSGHVLEVVGEDIDVAKAAIAALGQGGGAVYIVGVITRLYQETGQIPYFPVHDEVNVELPREWSNERTIDFFQFMGRARNDLLPGFAAPGKIYVSEAGTWLSEEDPKRPYTPELKALCMKQIGKVQISV